MKKLVIDLEMCSRCRTDKVTLHEIIEIGAVLLDEEFNEIGYFQSYIKPEYGKLTKFITDLTHIEQHHLENADNLETVFNNMIEKLELNSDDVVLCTWSDSDTIEILKELEFKKLDMPIIKSLAENYIDIQQIYGDKINFENQVALEKALSLVGIDFEGQAHGALADAINTARLYTKLNNDADVQKVLTIIKEMMTVEPMSTSLGSMIDFSKFQIE